MKSFTGVGLLVAATVAIFGCSASDDVPADGSPSGMGGGGQGSGAAAGVAGSNATAGRGGTAGSETGAAGSDPGSGQGGESPTGAGGTGSSAGGDGSAAWQAEPETSWQWQLTGAIDTSVDVAMYDIDLFDAPQATIDALKADGRVVICYFSAGSSEDWRPDYDAFQASDQGNQLDDWPGERWLDVRSSNVREIMKARLDLASGKGCDGVEPDNVDGFDNDNGLGLTRDHQLDYLRFLAADAHAQGLSIGLKNSLDLIGDLVGDFDWALNEECFAYDECALLSPFISQNKAVFHVEYGDESLLTDVCDDASTSGFSTLIKNLELDAWRAACP